MTLAALLALAPAGASAHVRWFVDSERYDPDWSRLLALPTVLVILVSGVLLLGLLGLRRLVGPHFPNPPFLAYMEPSTTTLLAVQTGISLVWFASEAELFVPSLDLGSGVLAGLLIAMQIGVAAAFITGLIDRGGALLLVATWLGGFLVFRPWELLDQILYVGIGVVLFVLGRTIPPPAVARRLLPLGDWKRQSVTALRVLAGLSFTTVAFTEKLLVPEAGEAFLAEHPEFNLLREYLGWSWWTDEHFTLAAGIVEASAGLLLIAGVLTRVVILGLLVPFNLTVGFLPPIELLGHLPIFGVMYVLLLYGSGAAPSAREARLDPALRGEMTERDQRLRGTALPGGDRPAVQEPGRTRRD